ncbi:MAG: hypothetical protein GY867_00615 [bacterium]|nr:hypothetical protein [bacterium]
MNCYSLKYMVFPMGTGLLVAGAVLVYKSWTPQQATLVIAGICIVVSVTILGKIISSSGGYNGEEDAPAFSACLGQIVAAFVTVAAVLTEGTDHPLPANYMYFIVLAVALVAAGRQPLLSGGSLIVIILSSAFLYWLPIMLL